MLLQMALFHLKKAFHFKYYFSLWFKKIPMDAKKEIPRAPFLYHSTLLPSLAKRQGRNDFMQLT